MTWINVIVAELLEELYGLSVEVCLDYSLTGEQVGYYMPSSGEIFLSPNYKDKEELAWVALHEFQHHKQQLADSMAFVGYRKTCELMGYENHPLEVDAEAFAGVEFKRFSKELFKRI